MSGIQTLDVLKNEDTLVVIDPTIDMNGLYGRLQSEAARNGVWKDGL